MVRDDNIHYDEFFKQNRFILSESLKSPLCIDPQINAMTIIRAIYPNNIVTLQSNDNDIMSKIEQTILDGRTVVVEDLNEHINPHLLYLLEKNLNS